MVGKCEKSIYRRYFSGYSTFGENRNKVDNLRDILNNNDKNLFNLIIKLISVVVHAITILFISEKEATHPRSAKKGIFPAQLILKFCTCELNPKVRLCNEPLQRYFCKHPYLVFWNFCCITCGIFVDLCCGALFGVTGLNVFLFFFTQEESSTQETKPSSNIPVITCKPSHTFMVKYYGALPVAVGTGIETVEEAAKVCGLVNFIIVPPLQYCRSV